MLSKGANVLKRSGFYLAGGTALALQLGHRQSVDFDFFSEEKQCSQTIINWLEEIPDLMVRDVNADTLHVEINAVKLSFIGGYRYPRVKDLVWVDGIGIADIVDIGLMKFLAITHRATVRDYIDIAAIFKKAVSLTELISLCEQKYGKRFTPMIFLRGLVSFEDLDNEMPRVFDNSLKRRWKIILRSAVKAYV